MSNNVFSKGDIKYYNLAELQGKTVNIVSVGKTGNECLIYMKDIKTDDIYVVCADESKVEYYKDFVLKNFINVDFSEIKSAMIVIYDHPKDYPNSYVARIWDMDKPTNVVVANENIYVLRKLIPKNMGCINKFETDDPCMLEIWL
jgi:hypothetical protein